MSALRQLFVGLGIIGLQADGFAIAGNRVVKLGHILQRDAKQEQVQPELEVGPGVVGLEANGLLELEDRFLELYPGSSVHKQGSDGPRRRRA